MADYQALYKQSLLQIQKQKDQIKKLQQEIRERCQSYLIHSSRYRSKHNNVNSNQKPNGGSDSRVNSQSAAEAPEPQLQFVSNAVNMTVQNYEQKPKGVDEQTQTCNIPENDSQNKQPKVNNRSYIKDTSSQNNFLVTDDEARVASQREQSGNYKRQASIQQLRSLKSNDSSLPENSSIAPQSQQRILERQNSHPQINWEEVVSGLKQRMSTIQKQKSDQAQKIIDLEQQIRNYKKQQKSLMDANNSSMKKKTTRSIQYSLNDEELSSAGLIQKLLQGFEDQLVFKDCPNLYQKIKKMTEYISTLKSKVTHYQNIFKDKDLQESKVQSYRYNTPYRKIKSKQNEQQDDIQIRDQYEENEIQALRNKCKQLQMELTKSREQKFGSPYNHQNHEELGENSYLIEEQLEKPNSPYVKRSFVRKKVVKRNLSAMILRSPSKSKQQSKAAMLNQLEKLKSHLQKSKDSQNEKQVQSLSRKIDKIEQSIDQKEKIDEISDEDSSIARTSGASQGFTEIIQVQTEGPGYKNYTAHILGLSRKDRSTQMRKKESNNY